MRIRIFFSFYLFLFFLSRFLFLFLSIFSFLSRAFPQRISFYIYLFVFFIKTHTYVRIVFKKKKIKEKGREREDKKRKRKKTSKEGRGSEKKQEVVSLPSFFNFLADAEVPSKIFPLGPGNLLTFLRKTYALYNNKIILIRIITHILVNINNVESIVRLNLYNLTILL